MAGKRKHKKDTGEHNLSAEQVQFIYNKVVQLGSVEAVAAFYNKDCAVDRVARLCALGVYWKGG